MAVDIARAWKDPEYRKTLTKEELASLPPNPAGSAELTKEQLGGVSAGYSSVHGPTGSLLQACSCKAE